MTVPPDQSQTLTATRGRSGRGLSAEVLLSRRAAIFWVFAAAYFLSQFFRSANAVIAGDLSTDIGLSAAQLGFMTSLFYASFAAVQLPLGAALDRFGPRSVTPTLMIAAAVGAVLFGSASGFAQLALGRALVGVGMAGVYMGALKAFSRWFSARRLATASGFLVAAGATGALGASAPLAWLDDTVGWRVVFLLGGGVIALSAALVAAVARNVPPGAVWEGGTGPGGLGAIFRSGRFWGIALMDFALVGTLLSMQGLWGGPLLFDVLGWSQAQAGRVLLTLSAGALVGYVTSGWVAARLGTQRVVVTAALGMLTSQAVLLVVTGGGPRGLVYLAFPLLGLSGSFNVLCMAHACGVFPTAMTGRAVTAVNLFGIGGAAVTQGLMGVVIEAFGSDAAGVYPPEAYAAAVAMTAGFCLVALVAYARLAWR